MEDKKLLAFCLMVLMISTVQVLHVAAYQQNPTPMPNCVNECLGCCKTALFICQLKCGVVCANSGIGGTHAMFHISLNPR